MINADKLEEIITYLALSEESKDEKSKPPSIRAHLRDFRPAIPFADDVNATAALTESYQSRLLRGHYPPSKIRQNFDITLIGGTTSDQGKFSLWRMKKIPLSEVRGHKVRSSHVAAFYSGIFNVSGDVSSLSVTKWAHALDRWEYIPSDEWRVDFNEDSDVTQFRFSALLQEYAYSDYFWHVTLGYEGTLGVKIRTDSDGAKEVFRLRDIPEGKSRRAALRNWVTQHYRHRPSTGDKDVKVVRHLRGAEKFHWNGLVCKIAPPLVELQAQWPDRYPAPEIWPPSAFPVTCSNCKAEMQVINKDALRPTYGCPECYYNVS